jgi:hypothetical protein
MDVEALLPGVPRVESPFFSEIFGDARFDEETRRVATELRDDGFSVIDFPEEGFDALVEGMRERLQPEFAWGDWRDQGFDMGSGLRIQDAWRIDPAVRQMATNPAVIELLSSLYGRRAWPFQTLTFPVGTQQHFHTDAVHFSSVPERFMCGVWVALEDVHEDAGPLVYYPGSHRWPIYTNEHLGRCAAELEHMSTQQAYEPLWEALVRVHGVLPKRFVAKKGQALIWAANLLHGGERQRDASRTRWSQVTHYFFDDCIYTTPMHSDPYYGSVELREPTNICTGETVAPRYAGHPLRPERVEAMRRRPPKLPDGFDASLYLAANPDVARAGMDPADHWLMYGLHEGRKLRP